MAAKHAASRHAGRLKAGLPAETTAAQFVRIPALEKPGGIGLKPALQ